MDLVVLRNDFHNTVATVGCEVRWRGDTVAEVCPSKGQWQWLRAQLCGQADCRCGGVRGPQHFRGKELIVDRSGELA